ncbi:hypothetical protein THAOC_03666 [Thalassiosira oceanica]|uniref:Uncharacterized protein n=1 Tax=Thalassiosira oceanica TaxID=159749 RepID=K0TAY6_THAOC|nr:hypothetical protein THAOC_03666 [Thalassiosira oceanica]|eukprot:EJK74645.1 hypothetical protein THAOC_03666 [Thalassiosira oceanica]
MQLLGEAGVVVDSSISVDEGDFARAQDHDPEVDGGDAEEAAVGGAADDDDDELLISDEGSPVAAAVPVADQFSDDSDGELLTDGLDGDDGGAGAAPSGLVSPALIDDDDIPDDDLLADD